MFYMTLTLEMFLTPKMRLTWASKLLFKFQSILTQTSANCVEKCNVNNATVCQTTYLLST